MMITLTKRHLRTKVFRINFCTLFYIRVKQSSWKSEVLAYGGMNKKGRVVGIERSIY